ncbi:MAG: DNA/RNA nuclease SfsA [Ruminococcaceae bacterium]|nr:DNA/RNA nuclease SfsA [Oscillospiraceae bacterium]
MRYNNITKGIFHSRPNRFIAKVYVDGALQTVHVKNTGRCKELLTEGCTVFLEKADSPARKTLYDLVAVIKRDGSGVEKYINMDSQAPNEMAAEWLPKSGLFPEGTVFRREVRHGASRFDFCAVCGDALTYIEVKGVTLERDGTAYFPDAPTERGVKHLKELAELSESGTSAVVLFVVQMNGVQLLRPNRATHPAFADALAEAERAGVKVYAVDCKVCEGVAEIDGFLPVEI